MRIKTALLTLILAISSVLLFNSCNGIKSGDAGFGSIVIPPVVPDSPKGASDGLGDKTQFYVGVNTNVNTIAHVRNETGFSNKCAIDITSTANQDIKCLVDIPEGEAFVNPLTLRFNVPPKMCRYLRRNTYWFYNQEVGVGPQNIVMNLNYNDSGAIAFLASYTCSVDGSAPGPCTGYPEVQFSITASTQTATCIYDTSSSDVGKNCCFGKYTLTKNLTYTVAAATSTVTNAKWGGELNNCIGGPGLSWPQKSAKGIPERIVQLTKDGVTQDYKLPALIDSIVSPYTFPVANYYDPVLHTHAGIGGGSRTTNMPYFIDPVDDRNGTPIPTIAFNPDNFLVPGNDSYSFECLDEAFEIKHRIRLYVREWDTYPDFLTYISTAGVTVVPDRGLATAPSPNCSGVTGPCDNFADSDDFLTLIVGLPGYQTPSAITRDTYFPNTQRK